MSVHGTAARSDDQQVVSCKRSVSISRKSGVVEVIQSPVRQHAAVHAPNFHAHLLHAVMLRAKDYPTVNDDSPGKPARRGTRHSENRVRQAPTAEDSQPIDVVERSPPAGRASSKMEPLEPDSISLKSPS
jgi:hypothetical protein